MTETEPTTDRQQAARRDTIAALRDAHLLISRATNRVSRAALYARDAGMENAAPIAVEAIREHLDHAAKCIASEFEDLDRKAAA